MKQLIANLIDWIRNIFKNLFKKKPQELRYFLPYQVVFQIRHQALETQEQTRAVVLDALGNFLQPTGNIKQQEGGNEPLQEQTWRNQLDPPTPTSEVITFPFPDDNKQIFSLVPVQVSGYDVENDMDTKAVISVLRDAYADLQENNSLDLGNGLSIQSISPNWLIGNLHHGGATGGPGGSPTQASAPAGFRVVSSTTGLLNTVTAVPRTDTYVAILDTVPSPNAIAHAYHAWPTHPLAQNLLFSSNGRLTIHRANQATLNALEHYSPALHDYLMPDHGTFIAGIINNGAPNATLDLYEVLSRYGVGTFTSVAQGISDAISNRKKDCPLIINCSFMFCLPDGSAGANLIRELGVPINALTSTGLLTRTMREVFEGIVDPGIRVVASSGNDSSGKPKRWDARFPAAFSNVIGVGALPGGNLRDSAGRYIPASYSNLADNPPENGFMTLGGEPGNGQGIRGMYISDFPGSRSINQTGWAWWAGTSFAAAIISGLLAAELSGSSGFLPPTPGASIPPGPYQTPEGETVILVNQG